EEVCFGKRGKLNPREVSCRRTISCPVDGLPLDDKLHFVEEPLEIVGCEVKTVEAKSDPTSQSSMELQERSRVHVGT
ncbi:hypothetical protein Tco_0298138, partial [Tanacetum coccineum]